jgi:hypothetical protein
VSSQVCLTFNFTSEDLAQREALHRITDFIFHPQPKEATPRVFNCYHQLTERIKEAIHFWNIYVDNVDYDDPRGIWIKESKGECTLKG